jgi:hypothetical protein
VRPQAEPCQRKIKIKLIKTNNIMMLNVTMSAHARGHRQRLSSLIAMGHESA